MKKKILAFMLCMILVANPCFASSTGVVTVSGGSIATGGLSGGYSQKAESAAITLSMALLHGLGVSIKLSQDALNAGKSAYSFVKEKFYEWVGGTSAEQLDDSQYEELKSRFEIINNGSNIDPDGNIYFNATAVELMRRFCKWLDVSDYINNYHPSAGGPTVNGTLYTNSFTFKYGPGYPDSHYDFSNNVAVVKFIFQNGFALLFYTNVANVRGTSYTDGDSSVSSFNLTRFTNNYYWTSSTVNGLNNPVIPTGVLSIDRTDLYPSSSDSAIRDYLWALNGFNVDEGSGEAPEGFNYNGDFDSDVLENPDDNNLVVEPDLIPALQNQNQGKELNIPVEDYLEALKQILNQQTNPQAVPEPIPAQDLPTLSPVPVSVPVDLPLEWPVQLPSSPDATPDLPTDNTPVTDPSAPVQPVDALPELTFNLDEYFPFCIPFDIYHLLSKFSAEPVTPEFDIGFTEPFTNTNVNFHVDLSPWDFVASAVRTAELGAFIVGLAVASRAIFTRG